MSERVINIDEMDSFISGGPRELVLFGFTYTLDLHTEIAFDMLENVQRFAAIEAGGEPATKQDFEIVDHVLFKFFSFQNKDFSQALLKELKKSFPKYLRVTKVIMNAVLEQAGLILSLDEEKTGQAKGKTGKKKEVSKK